MLKEYFSIVEIAEFKLDGYSQRTLVTKVEQENWLFRTYKTTKKDGREYHISNFPSKTREKIVHKLLERASKEARLNGKNIEVVQKSLKIAYSRLEIILFVKKTKVKVDAFCKFYNNREFVNNEITKDCFENVPSISKSRVYEWIKAYDKFGLEGLKFKADERRFGKGEFVKNSLQTQKGEVTNIEDLIIGAHLKAPHYKVKMLYKQLTHAVKNIDVSVPSYRTVCKIVSNWKQKNKSTELLASNPDKWKSKYLLAIGSYSDGITEPNQLWELDSSPSDVMLEGGRHMIVACIDVYSRRVKFLVSKTSNSLAVTSLLRACMIEWGIPKAIKTDNGKDYTSQQIKIVLNEFGIEHKLANPFSGQEKPHVERVFKRFQHDFVECLPNYVGHNVAERKALQSIKSFEDRLFGKEETLFMTSKQFQNFCSWWIETQYMNVAHHGLKMKTPASRLEGFTPKLPVGEQIHKLNLLLEPLAGLRTIVKKGIRVENTFYWDSPLAMYVGEQVQVRVDRFDMGKIYTFDQQGVFICEAFNYELLGRDKIAFIQDSKLVEKQAIKMVKEKTRRLIRKTKNLEYIEPIQIDLEEAIASVDKNNGNYVGCKVEQQEVDEGENRYKKAKELEIKLAKGEKVEELSWLLNYQNHPEYKTKESLRNN